MRKKTKNRGRDEKLMKFINFLSVGTASTREPPFSGSPFSSSDPLSAIVTNRRLCVFPMSAVQDEVANLFGSDSEDEEQLQQQEQQQEQQQDGAKADDDEQVAVKSAIGEDEIDESEVNAMFSDSEGDDDGGDAHNRNMTIEGEMYGNSFDAPAADITIGTKSHAESFGSYVPVAEGETETLTIPASHDFPYGKNKKLVFVKFPAAVNLEKKPYSEGADDEDDDKEFMTIRYREKDNGSMNADGRASIESNARMIYWPDGKIQLQIGNDFLDVFEGNTTSGSSYLYAVDDDEKTRRCEGEFESQMRFAGVFSASSKIRSLLKGKLIMDTLQQGEKKIKQSFNISYNPEKEKKEMIKLFEQKEQRRRLEEQRRERDREASAYRRRRDGGFRDEEDQDEEDEEEEIGASRFSKRKKGSEDDEDEDEDDNDWRLLNAKKRASETLSPAKKKKKASSDEDEDDVDVDDVDLSESGGEGSAKVKSES